MIDDWPLIRERFHQAAAKEGVEVFAKRIPIHFTTAYRLIRGDTRRPQKMTFEGIRRAVAEHEGRQSNGGDGTGKAGADRLQGGSGR